MKLPKSGKVYSFLFFASFFIVVVMLLYFSISGYTDPIVETLLQKTSEVKIQNLYSFFPYYFLLDFLFIISWFTGWFHVLVFKNNHNKPFCLFLFFFGLLGPILDFSETILSIILLVQNINIQSFNANLYNIWIVIRQLSYIVTYIIAVFYGIYVFRKKYKEVILSIISILGLFLGLIGFIFPYLESISYIWWPFWFLCMGIYYFTLSIKR